MPTASKSPCAKPGCGKLSTERFCAEHKTGAHVEPRRSPRERGYTSEWDRKSLRWRRHNPLCKKCEDKGKTTPAALVDHIIPVHVAPDRVLDDDNLMSLCRVCHRAKTDEDLKVYGAAK